MTFIGMLVVSILVGALAQAWKKRTGALWGFLTMLVQVATLLMFHWSIVVQGVPADGWHHRLAIAMFTWGAGLCMGLVVATLPQRSLR